MVEIQLTKEEYEYLINSLLIGHEELSKSIVVKKEGIEDVWILIDIHSADEIRELASDEVGLHFDENYEPTKTGWILEHFIDKFYTG